MPQFPSGTARPTNYSAQNGSDYPLTIDNDLAVYLRLAGSFAPRGWDNVTQTPNMTLLIDPSAMLNGTTLTEMGGWTTGSVSSGNANITSVKLTTGIQQGMQAIGYGYTGVAGALAQYLPQGVYVKAVTAAAPGAGSITLSGNANNTQTANLIFCQGVGGTFPGNSHGTTTLDGFDTGVLYNVFPGMVANGGDAGTNNVIVSVNAAAGSLVLTSAAGGSHNGLNYTFTIPIPAANPRMDLVSYDRTTGRVTWTKGSEAANPSPPTIPANGRYLAWVYTTTGTTALTPQSNIIDIRALNDNIQGIGLQQSIPSASTTDLGSISGYSALITGTTTITSLGSSAVAGGVFLVEFNGVLTLTYNASSLKTPNAANITTAAGDTCLAMPLGSGNWQILAYWPANGNPIKLTGPLVVNAGSGVSLTIDAVNGTHPTQTQDSAQGGPYNVGYLEVPLSGGAAKTTNYTAVLADSGKTIIMNATGLTFTIPANASVAYPTGTVLTIINIFAGNLTIAITSDTLTWAGTTTTGSRTLAQNGLVTVIKTGTTTWIISGTGLT